MEQLVVFTLDELTYALPLNMIIRVIHSVEFRNLPKAPEIVAGIINVRGEIIAVIDVRKRFGMKSREIEADDQLIIADTGKRKIALWVDAVNGVENIDTHQRVDTSENLSYAKYINGVVKVNDHLILIYDLEKFLNLEEESQLELALTTNE